MGTDGLDFLMRAIRTKRDEKLSTRSPARQISTCSSSYYADSSLSIPFVWESQPGTPKVRVHETPLPPLTPPPSYLFNMSEKPVNRHSKASFFQSIIPKLTVKKTSSPTSPNSPLSSPWSLLHSSTSSPSGPLSGELRFSSARTYFDSGRYEEDKYGSPVSTLCFGIPRGVKGRSGARSVKILQYA